MIFSIVKQSIEIRMRFDQVPKIYADSECAAVIGMLAKQYGLPVPERREDLKEIREALMTQAADLPATEEIEKLRGLLEPYEPKAPVSDEIYQLLVYAYENT
ncbi:MAG: DUF3837 domain-containing protein [Lachnospiraceae bacterium]|nr:DUF3837 domain-containing protein [Lachnospiraceae bacterium]